MRRFLWMVIVLSFLFNPAAQAQSIIFGGGSTSTGTVTSVTCGTGLSGGTITSTGTCAIQSTQSISGLSNLTTNGIVSTSAGNGTLGVTSTTGTGAVVLANAPTFTGNPVGPGGGNINYIPIVLGGSNTLGTAIPTGTTGYSFAITGGTIISATLIGTLNASTCSAVVDVWKGAAAVPTVANTITSSDLPTLTSGTYEQDTTLTGWTKTVAANNVFVGNIQSTTCDRLTLVLGVQK